MGTSKNHNSIFKTSRKTISAMKPQNPSEWVLSEMRFLRVPIYISGKFTSKFNKIMLFYDSKINFIKI